jgi:hypothetical protein
LLTFVKLRDIWADESAMQGGTGRIDVLPWLSKMTLDVIGLAGAFTSYQLDVISSHTKLGVQDSIINLMH